MRPTNSHTRGGFVLVTVIWMLAILSVITIGFSYRSMMERRTAWYGMDQAQARTMARGAAQRAMLELANKQRIDTYTDVAWYTGGRNKPYTGLNQRWNRDVDLLTEAQYFKTVDGADPGDEICTFTITDLSAYISLNHAPDEFFEGFDEFDFKITGSILARRESQRPEDQAHRFSSVDEVLTLNDGDSIDYAAWMGDAEFPGLRELFTVWGDPGEALINVNTASADVLARIPELDAGVLDAIVEYRAGGDGIAYTSDDRAFKDLNSMAKTLSISFEALEPIRKYCKTDSRLFKITAHATRRRGTINAFCTVIVELRGTNPVIRDWKEGIRAS